MKGRVLIVAGSDSGGGAGIQADIKTVSAFGGFAMTAITAVTAQNTHGVQGITAMSPDFVALQMRMVLDDLGADIVKLGMLGNESIAEAVADTLACYPDLRCIVDPVMIATSGDSLMGDSPCRAYGRLMKRAFVLTPNLPELAELSGENPGTVEGVFRAARKICLEHGPRYVLAKGGHLEGSVVSDLLVSSESRKIFSADRIESRHTHGTGCTLASALATCLAQGETLDQAVIRARRYVRRAILEAPPFGKGSACPMNHAVSSE
ncbi:bifunctional hydroxymethylpyrimidine kinase/phosphomethylpyrimidine kinase [Swaminathania salitolerans]|uniref:hydroxymethylpyrimidine kinase n=1 Tax=Swaminathania salitolerans TaxID=182838 RepID=A0A511BMT5_9PROT|nr:bifunctional hydroxymethylpyrimidine kinase/phosphomethylpyrimidine kinase [Swaminathania salitolerans]GBQ15478.1 phosphomethylpyrimidine kinase [Swaminathania salitolerans LMG 21291]GEL01372.1 hydroxymethylpyrimidine/phosphomethylpyrimidine kinase [Swaminathania salitolerans]